MNIDNKTEYTLNAVIQETGTYILAVLKTGSPEIEHGVPRLIDSMARLVTAMGGCK